MNAHLSPVLSFSPDIDRTMGKGSFRNLIAWQKSMALARDVYTLTESFPAKETFGLSGQLRRSSVSVPSNIAEGHGRITRGEWQHFLGQARGSLLEVQTQLLLSLDLGFGNANSVSRALACSEEVGRVLNGLLASSYRRSQRKPAPPDDPDPSTNH